MRKIILLGVIATLIAFNAIIVFDKNNSISLFSLKSAAALTQEEIENNPAAKQVKEEVNRSNIEVTTYTCKEFLYYNTGWKEIKSHTCKEQRTINIHTCNGKGTLWCLESEKILSEPNYMDLCENAYRMQESWYLKFECSVSSVTRAF
jgi:hypothetical protein